MELKLSTLSIRVVQSTVLLTLKLTIMEELKVTLACGISVDFTDKLDEPFNFIGTFADMLNKHKTSKNYEIRNSAIIEIECRAIKYAHKALAGYNKRAIMANEAVKLLINKLIY